MTRDKILVEREYDGDGCSLGCPLFSLNRFDDQYCAFSEVELLWDSGLEGYRRCPACLSTPGVEVE